MFDVVDWFISQTVLSGDFQYSTVTNIWLFQQLNINSYSNGDSHLDTEM